MIVLDEDALYCDFVEYYQVFDFRRLEVEIAARLAAGLRSNSRIRTKSAGMNQPLDSYLLASCVDALRGIHWAISSGKRQDYPKSVSALFVSREDEKLAAFSSVEELRAARNRILNSGGKNGN